MSKVLKFSFYALIGTIFVLILFEGILSIVYVSNTFEYKKKYERLQKNIISKKENVSVDPYNNKPTHSKKTLSNRYTNSMSGRWAPNTLARTYEYSEYEEGKGDGLYTDSYGFIHNGNPDRELFQKDFYNILFIGGSSAEGANSTPSNELTIAALIEKNLRKKNKNINVINSAKSAYKSFDEFLMIYNLFGNYDFQEIIFFNGWNDFMSATYSKKDKWNYFDEILDYDFQQTYHFRKVTLKIKYYADFIKSKLNYNFKMQRFNQPIPQFYLRKFQPEYDTYESKDLSGDFNELIRNYISNLRLIKSFCTEFGKKCKFILQPVYSLKNQNFRNEYEVDYHSNIPFKNYELAQEKFFITAGEEFKKLNKIDKDILFYDMSSLFEYDKELIFLDIIHYSSYANQKISEEITRLIEK